MNGRPLWLPSAPCHVFLLARAYSYRCFLYSLYSWLHGDWYCGVRNEDGRLPQQRRHWVVDGACHDIMRFGVYLSNHVLH